MANFGSYIAGDIELAQVGFYDENGFFCGAVTSLANGEDSGLARWRGLQSVDITLPTRQNDPQTGDGELQGSLNYAVAENATLGLQFGVANQSLEASVQGLKVKTGDFHDLIVVDAEIDQIPLTTLWVTTPGKKRVFGEPAAKGWETHIFNQGEISTSGPDSVAERTLRNYTYFMSLDRPYTWPWGEAFTQANEGAVAGTIGRYADTLGYPGMHALRGDGVVAAVTLDQTPVGVHTDTGVFEVWQYTDSTQLWAKLTAGTDYTVAADVLTFEAGAIPAAGDHVVIKYKWLPA